jgi:hypothetical protein
VNDKSAHIKEILLIPIVVILLFLSGCDEFTLRTTLGLDGLSLTPAGATVSLGSTLDLSVSGGSPPYEFVVFSGSGSVAPSAEPDEATYTAPGSPGTDIVQVSDSNGLTDTISILIVDTAANPLILIPSSITLSTNDVFSFTAQGGVAPYSYSVFSRRRQYQRRNRCL